MGQCKKGRPISELSADFMEPIKFSAILIVGDSAPKFAELTHEEIQTLWQDIQARSLPRTKLGWFDEKYSWNQLATNPKF